MSGWWRGIWNDPVSENPWALGMLIVCVAALLTAMRGLTRLEQMFWRRRQETTTMTDDRQTADDHMTHASAEARSVHDSVTDLRMDTREDETPAEWRQGLPDQAPTGYDDSTDAADTVIQEVPIQQTPYAPFTASAQVAQPMIRPDRQICEHCGGTGYMPGVNDHLRESIALLGDNGDEVIRMFYAFLLRQAPDLASLFPADLADPASPGGPEWETYTDAGKHEMLVRAGLIGPNDPLPPDPPKKTGREQRDKLLKALVALSELYDPADQEKMTRLDAALERFGRSHAAFVRSDGTIKGATWEEYAAVKDALFGTLVRVAGAAWKAEFTEAWSQAYDYAAAVMMVEQFRSGFSAPRFPRA